MSQSFDKSQETKSARLQARHAYAEDCVDRWKRNEYPTGFHNVAIEIVMRQSRLEDRVWQLIERFAYFSEQFEKLQKSIEDKKEDSSDVH